MKLNPNRHVLEGKRVVVVEDSIVRGTTSRNLIRALRDAGAKEVHMRISSPPYIAPCYYGIDTPSINELMAAQYSIEEIRQMIGADSQMCIRDSQCIRQMPSDPLGKTMCSSWCWRISLAPTI